MTESVHVYAGECTILEDDIDARHRQRGRVVVVHKPDDTVLVHDAEGYQPVAWLTRADSVYREIDGDGGFALVAVDGETRLRVESESDATRASHDATAAGVPAGSCPACDGALVRARGEIACLDCDVEHGLPRDAALLDSNCDCGLPRMAVERGARFELCVDRDCESLDAAIRERFDREWSCPDCGGDLRVLRERALFLGCENYPDCEASVPLPHERVVGECDCGLPVIETKKAGGGSKVEAEETGDGSEGEVGKGSNDEMGEASRCLDPDCAGTPEVL